MEKPKNVKGVQQLVGRIAVLNRFISRMGEKALPFYQRSASWTNSSGRLKQTWHSNTSIICYQHLPVLVMPTAREPMLLYIAATHQVVNTTLVVERPEDSKTRG